MIIIMKTITTTVHNYNNELLLNLKCKPNSCYIHENYSQSQVQEIHRCAVTKIMQYIVKNTYVISASVKLRDVIISRLKLTSLS